MPSFNYECNECVEEKRQNTPVLSSLSLSPPSLSPPSLSLSVRFKGSRPQTKTHLLKLLRVLVFRLSLKIFKGYLSGRPCVLVKLEQSSDSTSVKIFEVVDLVHGQVEITRKIHIIKGTYQTLQSRVYHVFVLCKRKHVVFPCR